ncbi:MAG TPA: putative dsRNA-binding protein [Solirubrobacterales bacterium]|jgi:ribonuclease-3|nr:putative dsRNA-binding protein [Solirubrobacterales bacterium]
MSGRSAADHAPGRDADDLAGRDAVAPLAALIADLPEPLRRQALTHSSWTERRVDSFERLAFLGDSVLGLSVAGSLYERFPDVAAGGLTKIHNQAVSGVSCAAVGRLLGVPEMLRANEPDGVTAAIPAEVLLDGERPLPEATEALIGACHIAFGFEPVSAAVGAAFAPRIELASETRIDFKSALQELLARRGVRVNYEVTAATGPPHRRTFEVAAMVESERVGEGEGRSKKAAEQVAAEQALRALGG